MDVFVQTLAREPYPTLFRASAARLHAAGFGVVLPVEALDMRRNASVTRLDVLMHSWRLRILPAITARLRRGEATEFVLIAEDDVVPCSSAANISAQVAAQFAAHPAVDVVAVGYQAHPITHEPAWGAQLVGLRASAAERLAAALTHTAFDPVVQYHKPHCCIVDRWLWTLNRAVRNRSPLAAFFPGCAARRGGAPCPVRWTVPLAGWEEHGSSLTNALQQPTRDALRRHVKRELAAARRRAGGKRVDVEDLPALAAKSGGADAAPAAVVREGRGCAGGRAVDSGWYGIVEASKEMTLQGGVGSVVRRGGRRNRRHG